MMTQKGINNYLAGLVGGLLAIIVSLVVYIYITDKADADESKSDIKILEQKVQDNTVDMLKQVYQLSYTSMNDIKDLQNTTTKVAGNYEALAGKLENLIQANKSDRELFMKKFDNHENRITELEKNDQLQDKNIEVIAKDRGIRLFSATW